ncbi:MAG: TRAP transporter substrate-binding protein DctP [Acidobacteriota bacterium]
MTRPATFETTRRRWLLAALLIVLLAPSVQAATVVKMATLVPEGSVWDGILRHMGAEWSDRTDGQVKLRLYPGGVAGDEPDIVRKMRVGQLQGAALTVAGLSVIDEGFEVFELPMFFESYDELYHVLDTLRPDFEKRLEAKGYVLLNWGQGGWVHIFSKKPVRSVDDLRSQKLFTWAGNDAMVQLWRRNGFQPVPLAATDILTGLQTGMVEAITTTPLAALSLQWFRQTPYMQDLGFAPLVGATVMSRRAWRKLTPEQRSALLEAARETEKELLEVIPEQDEKAAQQMAERGLEVVAVTEAQRAEWRAASQDFERFKHGSMKDTALLDKVRSTRDAFRQRQAGTP